MPSGTLWATCNVGATTENATGNYYKYGYGSTTYTDAGYAMYGGKENPLASNRDTATVVMGDGWHMPTDSQIQELLDNTNYRRAYINGQWLNKFTSKINSKAYVYFPPGGNYSCNATLSDKDRASIWSSTPGQDSSSAKCLLIVISNGTGYPSVTTSTRCVGRQIRGVYDRYLVVEYNVTDTVNPTKIGYSVYIDGFSQIEIDGVVQPSVVDSYTFTTTGKHIVKYTLTDPTTIGQLCLHDCSNIKSIIIPFGVTTIGRSAFANCTSLTSVKIPKGVTTIEGSVFSNCTSLTEISIPEGVTSIGSSCFQSCTSLTSFTLPKSVTTIVDINPLNACSGLTSIKVADGNTAFDSRNNCNAIIRKSDNALISGCRNTVIPSDVQTIEFSAFRGQSALTSITIPSSVTRLSYHAFSKTGLTSITIPSSVSSIDNYAFNDCKSLSEITCQRSTAPTITMWTFQDIRNGGTLYVQSGSTGYNVWMGTGDYYLGKYGWSKVII